MVVDATRDAAALASTADVTELTSLWDDVTALTDELLNRYEEVTLLYDLSRELGVVLDVEGASGTALIRSLQVVPAKFGLVLVQNGEDLVCVATAGDAGPDRRRGTVAYDAGALAFSRIGQVMVHAGGELRQGDLRIDEPVLAAPLITGDARANQTGAAGALVFVGHDGLDRFSAGEAQLAAAVARQLGLGVENARLVTALRETERLQRELELAAGIQRSLLPGTSPRVLNATFAAACLPAAHVGGDYYDFVSSEDGVVHSVVADVTGHGLGPGLIMAMTRSVLRAQLRSSRSLAEAVLATNSVMWDDLVATSVFITLFAVRYDPRTGKLSYVNGGHHPALLRRRDGSVLDLNADGMPLGVLPDVRYEEGDGHLGPGDALLIFSDGVVEAQSPGGALYGTARLRQLVAKTGNCSAQGLVDTVLNDLERFRSGAKQEDDITLVAANVAGEPASGEWTSA